MLGEWHDLSRFDADRGQSISGLANALDILADGRAVRI
jgi:hypothetical protein